MHREPLDNEQIAAWYGVEPEQRLRWLAQRRLRVDLRRPAPDGDVALVVNAGADPSQPASR